MELPKTMARKSSVINVSMIGEWSVGFARTFDGFREPDRISGTQNENSYCLNSSPVAERHRRDVVQ